MSISEELSKNFNEALLNGNWICTNLNDQLNDISWQQAVKQVYQLNSIALLTFHINYYINGLANVFEGGPLDIKDKYSFEMNPITSEEEWTSLKKQINNNTLRFSVLIKNLSDKELYEPFLDPKYGTNFRNISGILNHSFYHLGQIAVLKKITAADI